MGPYEFQPYGFIDFLVRDGKKTELDQVVDKLALATWLKQGNDTRNIAISRWQREGEWVMAEMYAISLFSGEVKGVVKFPAELMDAQRDGRDPRVKAATALQWAVETNPYNAFVLGCAKQFGAKGWLSAGQIMALCQVDSRRGVIPGKRSRRRRR